MNFNKSTNTKLWSTKKKLNFSDNFQFYQRRLMYYICILCTHFLVANKIFLHRFLFYAVYMLRYFCVPIFLQRSHSFYFSTQLNTVLSLYCLVSFLNLMEHVLNTIPLLFIIASRLRTNLSVFSFSTRSFRE